MVISIHSLREELERFERRQIVVPKNNGSLWPISEQSFLCNLIWSHVIRLALKKR